MSPRVNQILDGVDSCLGWCVRGAAVAAVIGIVYVAGVALGWWGWP